MTVEITLETRKRLIESIQRFFDEHMDEEIGELRASLVLDFCLQEVGPTVYNAAVADVRRFMEEKLSDVDGSCFRQEFGFWKR